MQKRASQLSATRKSQPEAHKKDPVRVTGQVSPANSGVDDHFELKLTKIEHWSQRRHSEDCGKNKATLKMQNSLITTLCTTVVARQTPNYFCIHADSGEQTPANDQKASPGGKPDCTGLRTPRVAQHGNPKSCPITLGSLGSGTAKTS